MDEGLAFAKSTNVVPTIDAAHAMTRSFDNACRSLIGQAFATIASVKT